jgi:hypothetical protein
MAASRGAQTSGNSRKAAASVTTGKRRFARTPCRVAANIKPVDADVRLTGTISDISPAGCFIEMLAPLPSGTHVEIVAASAASNFQCSGTVRNSSPGMGMGVRFDRFTTDQFKKLRVIVPEIPEVPSGALDVPAASAAKPAAPSKSSQPRPSRPANAIEVLEATLRVLLRKGLISKAELVQEIERSRAHKR